RLTLDMNRQRTSPYPPRTDPETTISRQFTLPTARTFTLSGSASLSALLPDDEIDQLTGRSGSGVVAYSSGRLPGDLRATASATLDNDPTTAWQPGLGSAALVGSHLTYNLPTSTTLTQLNLQVIADGRHSVPTSLTVTGGGVTRSLILPPIADSTVPGAVTTVPLTFPALVGRQFVVTFTGVRTEKAANYYSAGPLALPLGIAEIGIPGISEPPTPATVPGNCTAGLLAIDGQPIDVAVVGSAPSALDNTELQVVPCGPDANGITLSAGTHLVQTAVGHTPSTGWNIDQLVLDSAAGGGAGPAATPTLAGSPKLPATQPGPAPRVAVTAQHIDTESATVSGATSPFELVLGQSVNAGWLATATPGPGAPAGAHAVTLGRSQLVDSFANGWAVTGPDLRALGSSFTVTLTWTPQSEVWLALGASAVTLFLCLLLAFLPERWRAPVRRRLPRWARRTPASGREPVSSGKSESESESESETIGDARAGARAKASVGEEERRDESSDLPALELLRAQPAHGVGWLASAVLGLITGLVASAVTSLGVGLAVAVVVVAGLLVPRARWIAVAGTVAFIVAGCLSVITGQAVHHFLPGSNWAGSFVHAGNLIWIGVVLLLADAVIVSAGGRSRAAGSEPEPEPEPESEEVGTGRVGAKGQRGGTEAT
ncbi:MAG TPA: hypothetical protein VG298_00235, partial [Acidimicrobiales bacterium]|nr:hypothetical protein [Acidimicrobiales bacterium]